MQVELIGCTSAGKSTLTKGILQAYQGQGAEVILADDFVLSQIRSNWIKENLPRALILNLAALFACLVTWRNNLEFCAFAARILLQLPISMSEKLYLFRNVLKKIGTYEIIRSRSSPQEVILVDEGVLQTAHNLFVHVSVQVKREHISTFAELIPLPDVIVYLRQSESLLLDRISKRGHKRIPSRSNGDMIQFIKKAVATFDALAQEPIVESRLLVVNDGQDISPVSGYQDDPSYVLALNIVQSGISTNIASSRLHTTSSL